MAQKVSDADKAKANELKERGNKVLQSGQTDEAIDLYSEAILLDGTNHVLYSNRAACYLTQKNNKGALKDAEKCVELAPQWGKGYLRVGAALQALNRLEDAVKAYEKGLACQGTDAGTTTALQKGLKDVNSILNEAKAAKKSRQKPGQRQEGGGSEEPWQRCTAAQGLQACR